MSVFARPFFMARLGFLLFFVLCVAGVYSLRANAEAPASTDLTERKGRIVRVIEQTSHATSHLKLRMSVSDKKKCVPSQAWLVGPRGRTEIELSVDGTLDPYRYLKEFQTASALETAGCAGSLVIEAKMVPRLPHQPSVSAASLQAAVAEINAFIKAEAGVMSWAAPKAKGVRLRIGPGGTAILTDTSGAMIKLSSGSDGWIEIKGKLGQLESVSLSAEPFDFDFVH